MKTHLFITLIVLGLVNNINCIENNEYRGSSYSTQIQNPQHLERIPNQNAIIQQQKHPESIIYQNYDTGNQNLRNLNYKLASDSQNQNINQEQQLYYVQVEQLEAAVHQQQQKQESSSLIQQVQPQQYIVSDSRQYSVPVSQSSAETQVYNQPQVASGQHSGSAVPSAQLLLLQEQISKQNSVAPNQFQQTSAPENKAVAQTQQQLISPEYYPANTVSQPSSIALQNQPNFQFKPQQYLQHNQQTINQPQSVITFQHQDQKPLQSTNQLPSNIPQQYTASSPNQVANFPAYQQIVINNEPLKSKPRNGYKVRESPVLRQTQEYAPTNNAQFGNHQFIRDSQLFHDVAVHGQDIFSSYNYNPNLQNPSIESVQRLVQPQQQNSYNVFSDSIQGDRDSGLSVFRSPQQRFLNSGL